MIFYSRTVRPVTKAFDFAHSCVVIEDTEVIQDGKCVVVPKGTVNLFEKVQADRDSVNVYNILNRFARGDVSVISQRVGQFIDTVNMPKSIVDAHKQLDTLRKGFDSMPADFKEKFGFSFDTFLEKGSQMSVADLQSIAGVKNTAVKEVAPDVAE